MVLKLRCRRIVDSLSPSSIWVYYLSIVGVFGWTPPTSWNLSLACSPLLCGMPGHVARLHTGASSRGPDKKAKIEKAVSTLKEKKKKVVAVVRDTLYCCCLCLPSNLCLYNYIPYYL